LASQRQAKPGALICDLDQTLVDTRPLKHLRAAKRWSEVYERIPTCTAVTGSKDFLLRAKGIPMAIVTNSPSNYAARVLDHFGIRFEVLVAYHDVRFRKPHPEPTLLALSKLGVAASAAWCIGDQPEDIISGRAAGIPVTIGIRAASETESELLAAKPSLLADDWLEVAALLSRTTGS
jgi:phosphoglycolate phosphatase-like HAD superfamily hydrolase